MEKILDQYIKELITAYPAISTALSEFKIGCSTCSVGTCKLRDIIEIHGLSEPDEEAMFRKIAEIVFPGKEVTIPKLTRTLKDSGKGRTFSPPIKELVNEHDIIKMVIDAIPPLISLLKTDLTSGKGLAIKAISFIKNYADRFHHAKEEDILFTLFDKTTDIITVMNKEHEIGRSHVRSALTALEHDNVVLAEEHLMAYAALLTEHIRKEDEILYPWIDRALTDSQVGLLFRQFREATQNSDINYEDYVQFAREFQIKFTGGKS
jgi:hemerythrin-like domain-containing protein